ncbi:MAG TPA: lytic transglycosylase domain-containing protein [Clostridiaceae bacterium]|nr:lytic transglycosylase domain-containing protein [Clostridiaceae bacterium]
MNIPKMPDVSALLAQKISEIQSRLPVKMKGSASISSISFSEELSSSLASSSGTAESAAPVIDASLLTADVKNSRQTRFPLVSGSYESVYPRLSQVQIQELMPRINSAIETYSKTFGLDPELVRAVIQVESGFQPFALSTSGAMGLMQLMPETAAGLGVTDAYNIEQNILGGTQYLYYQLKTFDNDLSLALAAYNAGPNAVKKYNGIPPYEQTQNYVKKVLSTYEMYKALKGD